MIVKSFCIKSHTDTFIATFKLYTFITKYYIKNSIYTLWSWENKLFWSTKTIIRI